VISDLPLYSFLRWLRVICEATGGKWWHRNYPETVGFCRGLLIKRERESLFNSCYRYTAWKDISQNYE